jgi:uncharacterized SAM-binding protein YcdF (DUF218 family)
VFFFLSKLLDVFLAPLTWSMILIAAGGLFVTRRRRLGLILGASGLLVLYVFSLEGVSSRLWRPLEDVRSAMRDGVTYDAVILMGGVVQVFAEQPEGRRSFNDNVERLLATYDLLRSDRAKVAVISGGHTDPNRPEAKEAPTLADQLADWGIPRERLIVEATARNTYENAVEVKKLADAHGWKTVLVVTSAFHMPRTLGCFAAVGMSVDSLAVDRRAVSPDGKSFSWLPRATALDDSTDAIREWAGRWIYRLRGYSR